MSVTMNFQIASDTAPDLAISARIEGEGYNPDVFTDMVNRAIWAYKEALNHQIATMGIADMGDEQDD